MTVHDKLIDKAERLAALHAAPEILTLVNVWDVITARAVAAVPGTTALATASHAIAHSLGYADGEQIPVEEMIAAVGRIAAATDLPVTADLEAGYGNAGDTIRRAVGAGAVGANLEDQLKPLADAVRAVADALAAADAEGVPFVLNARTDAFVRAAGRSVDESVADAVERGQAFLAEGATCVFVPGKLDGPTVRALVQAFGPGRLSLIAVPGGLSVAEMAKLGVARVSSGPWPQRVAITSLVDLAAVLQRGSAVPAARNFDHLF